MSEINEQDNGEQIFATESPESDNTDSNDTTIDNEDVDSSEQEDKELKLKEPEQPTSGADQKEKQIQSFVQAIKDDKKSFDDIPEKWLKNEVKARLNTLTTPVERTSVKSEVRQAIIAEREEQRYSALISELNVLGLDRAKQDKLQEEYTNFRGLNLSKLNALESAMKIANVDLQQEFIERKRQGMKIPKASYRKSSNGEIDTGSSYEEIHSNVSEEKRIEHLRKLTSY